MFQYKYNACYILKYLNTVHIRMFKYRTYFNIRIFEYCILVSLVTIVVYELVVDQNNSLNTVYY